MTVQPLDVTANGYKHGITKKALGTAKARWTHHPSLTVIMYNMEVQNKCTLMCWRVFRSLLCKLEVFHSFLSLVSATESSVLPDSLR